jgi:hypothetical protein
MPNDESVAAKAALHRENHAFRRRDRDRRIERVAAALHDAETDECRSRMRGRDHAAHPKRLRAPPRTICLGGTETPSSIISHVCHLAFCLCQS